MEMYTRMTRINNPSPRNCLSDRVLVIACERWRRTLQNSKALKNYKKTNHTVRRIGGGWERHTLGPTHLSEEEVPDDQQVPLEHVDKHDGFCPARLICENTTVGHSRPARYESIGTNATHWPNEIRKRSANRSRVVIDGFRILSADFRGGEHYTDGKPPDDENGARTEKKTPTTQTTRTTLRLRQCSALQCGGGGWCAYRRGGGGQTSKIRETPVVRMTSK